MNQDNQSKSSGRTRNRRNNVARTQQAASKLIDAYKKDAGDHKFSEVLDLYRARDNRLLDVLGRLDRKLGNRTPVPLTNLALPKFRKTFNKEDATPLDMRLYFFNSFKKEFDGADISYRQFLELLAVDGVASDLVETALPILVEHGPAIAGWLFDKIVSLFRSNRSNPPTSESTSGTLVKNANSTEPRYVTSALAPRLTDTLIDQMSVHAANPGAVCTVICPELYQVAKAVYGAADVATVTDCTMEYSALTDANGNFAMYVNMHGLNATGASGSRWFTANTINNAAQQFVPSTGVAAAAGIAYSAGPYYNGGVTVARDFIMLGCVIEILPIISDFDNAGMIEVGMAKTVINQTFNSAGMPAWPQADLATHAYYKLCNMKNPNIRFVWLPTDPTDTSYLKSVDVVAMGDIPYNDQFYILFTGCKVSTNVARIKVKPVIQFHPDAAFERFCKSVQVPPGIRTSDVITNLATLHPDIWSFNFEQARALCDRIIATRSNRADDLLHAAVGIRHRE